VSTTKKRDTIMAKRYKRWSKMRKQNKLSERRKLHQVILNVNNNSLTLLLIHSDSTNACFITSKFEVYVCH